MKRFATTHTVMLAALACFAVQTACLSSSPVVPVTPSNSAQVANCENTATLHDGIVVGDFVFGGLSTAGAGVAAGLASSNGTAAKDVGIASTALAAVAATGAGLAALSAANFVNNGCAGVVGPLPAAAAAAASKP